MKNGWFSFRRSTPDDRERKRIAQALDALASCPADKRLNALASLIKAVRPAKFTDVDTAQRRLHMLTSMVVADGRRAEALRNCLLHLLGEKQCLRMFTDAGVLSDESFGRGLKRRIGQRMLPEELDLSQMRDVVRMLFYKPTDHFWVEQVGDEAWIALLDALKLRQTDDDSLLVHMNVQTMEALQVLSYRIAAVGLDPELVRILPSIERYESPFVMQNVELRDFLEERKLAQTEKRRPRIDDKHLLVLLDQCEKLMIRVRRQAAQSGTSVDLTARLTRLQHMIDRQKMLLELIGERRPHELNVLRVQLFKQLVRAENRRYSVREWWSQTVELLALRVTQNSGKTGEQYITNSIGEYFKMLRSAMGAGFFVAFMALLKLFMSEHHLPPFVQAVSYSLDYGIGFVVCYLLHLTIATKQPAMTASYIAQSLDAADGGRGWLDALTELIVRTSRSQFIAVIGNVTVAFALSVLICWAWLMQTGEAPMTVDHAQKMLKDNGLTTSPSIIYAGITGVWLFLAGLVAGYYDNRAVYSHIAQRIGQMPGLRRWLGPERAGRFGDYISAHLGGIAGNFFFGCCLGSTAAIGAVLGVPLDIRHISFATANVAYSLATLGFDVPSHVWLQAAAGIAAIGMVNLSVSFTLAMWVALRSQRVRFKETRPLLRKLLHRWVTTPTHFLFPPLEEHPDAVAAGEALPQTGSKASIKASVLAKKGPPRETTAKPEPGRRG